MRRAPIYALIAIVLIGCFGAASYVHDYYRYRGFPPPVDPPGVAAGKLVTVSFYSPALHAQRQYHVYLPPGYAAAAAAGKRFPVLYMLHGHPGRWNGFIDVGHVGVDVDVLLHQHRIKPFLIVIPDGSDGTYRSDTQWADTPHGRFDSFVLDVVHAVDRKWPTIPNRKFRAIAGNSAGAYAAMNLTLRHIGTFGAVESWSGYFRQQPAGPFAHASAALLRANSPADYLPQVASKIRSNPLHAFLYGGTLDPDTRALPAFAAELHRAGATVQTAVRPGHHDWRLWRSMAVPMLRWASARFGAVP